MRCNQKQMFITAVHFYSSSRFSSRGVEFYLFCFIFFSSLVCLVSHMRGAGRSSSRRPPRRDWQQQSRASSSSKDDALVDLDDPTVKLWARLAVYALVFVAPGYALDFHALRLFFFFPIRFSVSLCLLSLSIYLSSRRLISLSVCVFHFAQAVVVRAAVDSTGRELCPRPVAVQLPR
jgi:hypothetical protein